MKFKAGNWVLLSDGRTTGTIRQTWDNNGKFYEVFLDDYCYLIVREDQILRLAEKQTSFDL